MKVQRVRSLSGCWYVYFVAQNGDSFGLESFVCERDAQQYEDRARHALAADAELDNVRDLQERNESLRKERDAARAAVPSYQDDYMRVADDNVELRRQLCRVRAAGPGDIEAAIRILKKYRDIQNSFVETPMLREQLKEAQEKYDNLRMGIKNLL